MSSEAKNGRAKFVVGIGASAGGLEALEEFFDKLPRDTGMAFVVVQHLSPDFKSLMDELLARHTELPVLLVEDGMRVEPNHVYLIPPRKEMIISGHRLLLSERDRQQERSLPIDIFFRSLAQDCGPSAIAIVLSGGGSDGSRGIRDVAEAGGLVIVQDNASARFDGMPKTARDAGVAEWVLAPQDMPGVLLQHARARLTEPSRPRTDASRAVNGGLGAVYGMLEEVFGIDFTHYKPSTVTRRIARRLQLARSEDIAAYAQRLRADRMELDTLYRDLLIGVTRFFRNEEAFATLEQEVLPDLFRRGPPDVPLRVWVAGCATGEEAYTLAILLHELSARHGRRPVKIFASDVHSGSLAAAGRAIYDEQSLANVSPSRIERFFRKNGQSTYQLIPEIRQMVVFAQHNVIRDAPFTRMDLISCRNLLIYLQPPAQQKVLSLFHFALNRGGVAFLGPSETTGQLSSDFETIDRRWRMYRKYSDVRVPVEARLQPSRAPDGQLARMQSGLGRQALSGLISTYDALLDDFMPPSLLVGERGELVQAFGGASRFLRMRDGRQGLDVLELVDTELKMVLAGGLQRAKREPSGIVFKGVRITDDAGEARAYHVRVRSVAGRGGGASHVLVSFEATDAPPAEEPAQHEIDLAAVSRDQLGNLEVELAYTKENLHEAIEELETSNEELQATNEELLTSNEELQSTNEELQSVNEELYTVNAEYQRKIAELTELANDMDNLMSSTEIGTIFLDSELRIRKFTPRIAETWNLVPHDVGRPIDTFTHTIAGLDLDDDLKRVLSSGSPVERELRDQRGRAFFLRLLPYRAKGTIDGVVLTLIDVSGLKAAEDALFHERYLLNSLLATVPDAIYFKDMGGRFIRMNGAMAGRLGLSDPREGEGKTAFELPDREPAAALHAQDLSALEEGRAEHYVLQKRVDGRAAGQETPLWDIATRLPLVDRSGQTVGIIGILRDVTELKNAEQKVSEGVRRRDEFLAMLSHELRNPLGALVTAAALLKTDDGKKRLGGDRLIQIIDRQSQQMSRLLDDLLDVSRVTQNKIELKRELVDLRGVLRDAIDAVRSSMEARGVHLSLDIDGEGELFVSGDPARLHQVHANLLNNAAKYTARGGHVAVEASRRDGEAVVIVRDDGAGIRPDLIESIFDLFVQSPRTLDRAQGGLGVGLTLVRALVTMHGGSVTARSDGEGKGSEFEVRLPLAAEAVRIAEPVSVAREKLSPGARGVVIEDNDDSREMLCELLARVGYECRSAATGDAGLALIEEVSPDFAVVDLGLPGIDGFELARRIRDQPRHAQVVLIALTGYGQPADRANTLRAGFDEHLVKPISPSVLMRALERCPVRSAPR